MVRNVAPLMQNLEKGDFYLLSGIEHGMRFGEWVSRDRLPSFSELDENEVAYRLDRCLDFELIERKTIQYEGYRLKFEGYDTLALRTFSERGTIQEVGAPLGEGKESDVLEARNSNTVALKFHREGLTNFREVQREREYTADRSHTSWIYTARKAAEREFEVLEELYPRVSVPKPIDQNRHAIVMERMAGHELSRVRVDNELVPSLLRSILEEIANAYALDFVHADISEYNVFVSNGRVTIFDWPQAVTSTHPNANELLKRDVDNIVSYFERKYPRFIPSLIDRNAIFAAILDNSLGDTSIMPNK